MSLAIATQWIAGTAFAACLSQGVGQAEVYPTADQLPENLLRVYVYFPRAMGTGDASRHLQLLDANGTVVDGVFLANRAGLWSPDRRRLTLLLNPARIKKGLVAHNNLGRALVPGQSYTFAISGAALDAEGCTLGVDTYRSFRVVTADTQPPDPANWQLSQPAAHTKQPLIVDTGSPHDHLSLAFRLRVRDAGGAVLAGAISLGDGEALWRFVPSKPWEASTYTLSVDPRLEDLAGNRPGIPFDRPMDQEPEPWMDTLYFSPAPETDEP